MKAGVHSIFRNQICKERDRFSGVSTFSRSKRIGTTVLVLLHVFLILPIGCNGHDKTSSKVQKTLAILEATKLNQQFDCVYCTAQQAFQGVCTCYSQISFGSCPGSNAGSNKSNSYNVSCQNLIQMGHWTQTGSNSWSCNAKTCPAQVYTDAFSNGVP